MASKPPCNIVNGFGGRKDSLFNPCDVAMLRDNFTTSTWLLIGATLQTLLFLLPLRPSYALAPAVLLLSYRFINTLLMSFGLKQNSYMDGAVDGKRAVVYPPPSANEKQPTCNNEVCLLVLAARCNHPLGLFAPGYKDLSDHFKDLIFNLDAGAPANGFLGGSSYLNVGDRPSAGEIMSLMYFRSYDHLRAFAHADAHRAVWHWWNTSLPRHAHLAISHEIYSVPKGRWQGMYTNYHPSNFGATAHLISDEKGEERWVGPLVDARKGRFRTSNGRMGISQTGDENDVYGDDPYVGV